MGEWKELWIEGWRRGDGREWKKAVTVTLGMALAEMGFATFWGVEGDAGQVDMGLIEDYPPLCDVKGLTPSRE